MYMAKRIFSFLLALLMALSLCACGGTGDGGVQPSNTPPETVSQLPASEEPSAEQPEADQSEELPAEDPSAEQPEADQSEELPSEEPSALPESAPPAGETAPQETPEETPAVTEDGWYSSKDEVALYIHLYGHLPDNYVTKREAQELGWTGGSVEQYAGKGTAIGGSRFGNYEGLLPDAKCRTFTECDIDTVGRSSRGAKRIIFSNDGLVYYTEDHYESFELLYGEP